MRLLVVISLALVVAGCGRTTLVQQDPNYPREPLRVPKYLYKDPDIKAIVLPVPRFQAGSQIDPNLPNNGDEVY
jgi:hypothetical protein